jgi:hypothetical protein
MSVVGGVRTTLKKLCSDYRCWWFVWLIFLGFCFYLGLLGVPDKLADWATGLVRRQYVVAPQQITDGWIRECLIRVEGLDVQVDEPGTLRFFYSPGSRGPTMMGVLVFDREDWVLNFTTGFYVAKNPYIFEVANYRNLVCDNQRLTYDEEKEFFSLAMDLDVAAGATAAQVEQAGRAFARDMAGFAEEFM